MNSETVDTALAVTKFVSIAITCLFAILGLTKKYRDESGALTRWGRIAVSGAIGAFLIAAIAQSLELEKARRAALAASVRAQDDVRRFTQLLTEINRAAHPITDIRVGFSMELPRNAPALVDYITRLDATAREILSDFKQNGQSANQDEHRVVVFSQYGQSEKPVIAIEGGSSLLPPLRTQEDAIFGTRSLMFQLFKRAIKNDEITSGISLSQPDVSFIASGDAHQYGGNLGVHYYTADRRIEHEGVDIKAQFLKLNGALTSTLDIPGSTMVVEPVNYRPTLEHDLRLDSVFLRLSQGYEFSVPSGRFQRVYRGDMPVFIYRFPPLQ